MKPRLILALAFAANLTAAPHDPAWFTGEDFSLFNGALTPSLDVTAAFGGSTADPADLANGHHDPQDNATLQALHPSLTLQAGHLEGFAVYSANTDAAGNLDGSLEEGYLRLVELPFHLEVRGGQFLNLFGFQNELHNHEWSHADQNLVNGRFLNEGELTTLGGEVTWLAPLSTFTVSFGGLPSHGHDHDHEHGEEEEHVEFEPEGAHFDSWLASARWNREFIVPGDGELTGMLSGAWGENEFGRLSSVYGLGGEYRLGGWRWRTEAMLRRIEALSGHHGHEEHEEEHHEEEHEHHEDEEEAAERAEFDEFGFYSVLGYEWTEQMEASLRGEWVSGIDAMGLDSRWRISPAVTWRPEALHATQFRLQYNYDLSDAFGAEHSIWAQISWRWGAGHHHHDGHAH